MQPVSGNNWTRLSGTAAGTTVVANRSANLEGIFYGGAKTGTVTFYDAKTAAGTSDAGLIGGITNAGALLQINMGIACKKGIVAITSGTTDMVVVWH